MSAQLEAVLAAVSDPTRRAIIDRLAKGPSRVTDLAEPLPISLAAVSKHIQVPERAGLVRRARQGREYILALDARRSSPRKGADHEADRSQRVPGDPGLSGGGLRGMARHQEPGRSMVRLRAGHPPRGRRRPLLSLGASPGPRLGS